MSDPASNDSLSRHSPTASSANASSSSDLDTESTGSFFHDRSTTLGTLMGVTFPSLAFRTPSQHRHQPPSSSYSAAAATVEDGVRLVMRRKGRKKSRLRDSAAAERRRKWWRLCRDDECRTTSLGEFLEIERRFGGGGGFYGGVASGGGTGRALFEDGRVLPPVDATGDADADAAEGTPDVGICRLAASLTGICSGGVG